MSREKLSAAASHFMNKVLPAVTQKHYSDLANPEVMLGAYRRYTGGPVQSFGKALTPEFVLKVSPGPVPIQNGVPSLGDAAVAASASDQPLYWMRFAADAKVDDQATIQDLMGDLDTYTQRKFNLAGVDVEIPGDVPQPPDSAKWAQTIQANRGAMPDNISTLTEVPAALRPIAPTVSSLQLILGHFFSYDDQGAYYARWSGTGRSIPKDLSDIYKQNNVRELKLARDEMFVYMLTPKSLFTSQAAEAHDFRESVIRLDETGDPSNPYMPTLIHSVYKRIDNTPPFHDFVFFESEDGIGLNIPAAAKAKMSPVLAQFLLTIPDLPADRARFFHESTRVIEGDPALMHLIATVTGPVDLPAGATAMVPDSGGVIAILSPIDKVMDIAALPAVKYLEASGTPQEPHLNLVRPAIEFDPFRAKFAAGKQDGEGVLVGVIDSGIDGSHPAFKDASGNTRIVAVWEQDDGGANNANSPKAKHATDAAYASFVYGRERTGADVSGATDTQLHHGAGHGTHVTGTAAGAEVTGATGNVPRGIASKAKIVMVKSIGVNQGNIEHALQYIFIKAKELNLPCVVNMSFGNQGNSHDGTDELSRILTRQLRDGAGNYLKGRVLVVSAGNDRWFPIHVRRDLATGNSTVIRHTSSALGKSSQQFAVFWIRSLTSPTKPNLRVAIRHNPTGWTSAAVTPTSTKILIPVPGIGVTAQITYGDQDPHNGDYNLNVALFRPSNTPLVKEEWGVVITNMSPPIEMHGWAVGGGRFEGLAPTDNSVKVSAPGSARDVITVACSCSRLSWPDIDTPATTNDSWGKTTLGDIAAFSSPGPLRTCSSRMLNLFFLTVDLTHPALDIAAPGSATQSAMASNVPTTAAAAAAAGVPAPDIAALVTTTRRQMVNNASWMMEGTSMAAPVITGLVACMLAEEKDLTQEDVRNRMRTAGKLPAGTATIFDAGAPDPDDWGTGLIKAPALKP